MAWASTFSSRLQGRLVVCALPSMTAPATPKQPALSFSPLRNLPRISSSDLWSLLLKVSSRTRASDPPDSSKRATTVFVPPMSPAINMRSSQENKEPKVTSCAARGSIDSEWADTIGRTPPARLLHPDTPRKRYLFGLVRHTLSQHLQLLAHGNIFPHGRVDALDGKYDTRILPF